MGEPDEMVQIDIIMVSLEEHILLVKSSIEKVPFETIHFSTILRNIVHHIFYYFTQEKDGANFAKKMLYIKLDWRIFCS